MATSEVEEPTDRWFARPAALFNRRAYGAFNGTVVEDGPALPPESHQLELLPPASHQLELLPLELPPIDSHPPRAPGFADRQPSSSEPASAGPATAQRPSTRDETRRGSRRWGRLVLRTAPLLTVAMVAALGATIAVVGDRPLRVGTATARPAAPAPAPAPNTDLGRLVDPSEVIADPTVLVTKQVDYLYASQFGYEPPNIPVRTFTVLGKWGPPIDAMPTMPAWAASWVWNPDVRLVRGRYVMWFTAAEKNAALPVTGAMPRCIGWATADSPLGPFVPSPTPVLCQPDHFGAIDPRTFVAPGGQEWLYWKSDDNAVLSANQPTVVWAQPLAGDGTTLEGQATAILANTASWEGRIVESPQMVLSRGRYYLFFSGNTSGSIDNGIGVASCEGPAGPCANTATGPWLGPNMMSQGVGEESLFTQGGATWMLYSPHSLGQRLAVSRVAFGRQGPYMAAFGTLPGVAGHQKGHTGTPT